MAQCAFLSTRVPYCIMTSATAQDLTDDLGTGQTTNVSSTLQPCTLLLIAHAYISTYTSGTCYATLLTHSYTQFAFIINAHDDVKSRVYSRAILLDNSLYT